MGIKIEDLTVREVREIASFFGKAGTHSLPVGEAVLIRTVTLHYTGCIKSITDRDLVLSEAAWIADTGRFSDALKNGFPSNAEIEPFTDDVIISRDVIVDVTRWRHDLPKVQK